MVLGKKPVVLLYMEFYIYLVVFLCRNQKEKYQQKIIPLITQAWTLIGFDTLLIAIGPFFEQLYLDISRPPLVKSR
jgi:hypothetical protein